MQNSSNIQNYKEKNESKKKKFQDFTFPNKYHGKLITTFIRLFSENEQREKNQGIFQFSPLPNLAHMLTLYVLTMKKVRFFRLLSLFSQKKYGFSSFLKRHLERPFSARKVKNF
jgi:hypothetical protein